MDIDEVLTFAAKAKEEGSSRVCLGAAWREVKNGKDFDQVLDMVRQIKNLDLEVCCTLGMLSGDQAIRLKEAGLFAYNHNLDSSPEYYQEIISTRNFDDRLNTLQHARKAGLTLCSGGIIGMGESVDDRLKMLLVLSSFDPPPESVPINALVPVEGTPLGEMERIHPFELVRMISMTRIVLPKSMVRLSAGRRYLSQSDQALCLMAGANSIFSGEKLLTTSNPEKNEDDQLFELLGLSGMEPYTKVAVEQTQALECH
jgi:biotin synthase